MQNTMYFAMISIEAIQEHVHIFYFIDVLKIFSTLLLGPSTVIPRHKVPTA